MTTPTAANSQQATPDVAHQPHYTSMGIQPIQFMAAALTPDEFRGFLKGNIIKYTTRASRKGGIEDVKKAQVYMRWLHEFETTGTITIQEAPA